MFAAARCRVLCLFTLLLLLSCAHAPAQLSCEVRAEQEALRAYLGLVDTSPSLFEPRGDPSAGEVEIIVDPERIQQVEARMFARLRRTHSAADAWAYSRAGVLMQDDYVLMLRDAVVFPSGETGLYYRKISRARLDGGPVGAYALPVTADGHVVLVREWRHQERLWRLGLPGGYRDAGETAAESARREAREETGCDMPHLELLGEVDPDTERVPLFWGRIEGTCSAVHPDETEALGGTVLLTMAQWHQALLQGYYDDENGRRLFLHGTLASAYLFAQGRALL
jgi:ADP-ribose pyrophosphatase